MRAMRRSGSRPQPAATPVQRGAGASRRGPCEVSLARALSKLGVASRSEAARLVRAGRVTVNGDPVDDADRPVVPERARIAVDGRPVTAAAPLTILLHKPRGVVTTRRDPGGRPTVFSLLTAIERYVSPVGRLDVATSGLLLLTNDTRFGDWLADPRQGIPRVYLAEVGGAVSEPACARMLAGIDEGGERLRASAVRVRKRSARETHLVLELCEGKNREIRRLLDHLGHPVRRLKRVAFGGLTLGNLAPGAFRVVERAELEAAFPGAPLRPPAAGGGSLG
jgi:23S rRNA pseudouridine2605 synthase